MRRCVPVVLAVLVAGCGGGGAGGGGTEPAAAPPAAGRILATLDAGMRPCAMTAAAGSLWITAYSDGVLAQVDSLWVLPTFSSLFHRKVEISHIAVDGGTVVLRFRHYGATGLTASSQAYMEQWLQAPEMREWFADAEKEVSG